jgi:hypothetical protein
MQITDSSYGHRAITLATNETLDSTTCIAALVASELYNRQQAAQVIGDLFDALESAVMDARLAA